jgi:CRISPR/Cas system-associated exonuclease Cas4 (RecB family)
VSSNMSKLETYAEAVNAQALVELALADRGVKPNDRLLGVVHCSELGYCGRSIYYCLQGEEPINRIPSDLQAIFDAGHTIHGMIQQRIEEAEEDAYKGMLRTYMAEAINNKDWGFHVEQGCGDDELLLAGHIDGIVTIEGQPDIGVEFKTINKNGFSRLSKPQLAHVWQVHCYMRCTGIREFRLVYYCKDNSNLLEFTVKWDDKVWKNVERLIKQLLDHHQRNEPPMQPLAKPGRNCSSCRYQHLCELSGEYGWQ